MIVRQASPTYETIQWTGANLTECTAFVEDRISPTVTDLSITTLVDPPGDVNTFKATGTMFSITARMNDHILYGPLYGNDRVGAHFAVVTASEMTTRYDEVL